MPSDLDQKRIFANAKILANTFLSQSKFNMRYRNDVPLHGQPIRKHNKIILAHFEGSRLVIDSKVIAKRERVNRALCHGTSYGPGLFLPQIYRVFVRGWMLLWLMNFRWPNFLISPFITRMTMAESQIIMTRMGTAAPYRDLEKPM